MSSGMVASYSSTIIALATPAGHGGVAVVRLSGSHALAVSIRMGMAPNPVPRKAMLTRWRHPATGEMLDEGLSLYFAAPHSFTGEDVVEWHCHGSMATVRALLDAALSLPDVRMAEAGEFTRRAFQHGKMDLLEAEGLADVIAAQTEAQRRQALRQMTGAASHVLESWREALADALALEEAYIDFPDEDIPSEITAESLAHITAIRQAIMAELAMPVGERIRSGITITILGAPNVGKSSLINWLARRELAIVSPTAGTTRDSIECYTELAGVPVTIIDTAGLREAGDAIEQEGIRRAYYKAETADAILLMADHEEDFPVLADVAVPVLRLHNKCELSPLRREGSLAISIQQNHGMDELHRRLEALVMELTASSTPPLITQLRHRQMFEAMADHLARAAIPNHPAELRTEDLRLAVECIGKLTGRVSVEETLGRIFSRFCIGK